MNPLWYNEIEVLLTPPPPPRKIPRTLKGPGAVPENVTLKGFGVSTKSGGLIGNRVSKLGFPVFLCSRERGAGWGAHTHTHTCTCRQCETVGTQGRRNEVYTGGENWYQQ